MLDNYIAITLNSNVCCYGEGKVHTDAFNSIEASLQSSRYLKTQINYLNSSFPKFIYIKKIPYVDQFSLLRLFFKILDPALLFDFFIWLVGPSLIFLRFIMLLSRGVRAKKVLRDSLKNNVFLPLISDGREEVGKKCCTAGSLHSGFSSILLDFYGSNLLGNFRWFNNLENDNNSSKFIPTDYWNILAEGLFFMGVDPSKLIGNHVFIKNKKSNKDNDDNHITINIMNRDKAAINATRGFFGGLAMFCRSFDISYARKIIGSELLIPFNKKINEEIISANVSAEVAKVEIVDTHKFLSSSSILSQYSSLLKPVWGGDNTEVVGYSNYFHTALNKVISNYGANNVKCNLYPNIWMLQLNFVTKNDYQVFFSNNNAYLSHYMCKTDSFLTPAMKMFFVAIQLCYNKQKSLLNMFLFQLVVRNWFFPSSNLQHCVNATNGVIFNMSRSCTLIPALVDERFWVHNGLIFKDLWITKDYLGKKTGEFFYTKRKSFKIHIKKSKKGKKKKR